jgi:hypothetical protein
MARSYEIKATEDGYHMTVTEDGFEIAGGSAGPTEDDYDFLQAQAEAMPLQGHAS